MRNTKNNQSPVLNFQDLISADGGQLFVDSLKVADVFGKRHDEVLRAIRNLFGQLPAEFTACYFSKTAGFEATTKGCISYRITRDGFALLARRLTGKMALTSQMSVINAFNAKAVFIKNLHQGKQYQLLQKEVAYLLRKKSVSASARDMRCWQDDKPAMLAEVKALLSEIQPSLGF
jgi:Rha family phage regulatory protein